MGEGEEMHTPIPKALQDGNGHVDWKSAFEWLSRLVLLVVVALLGYGLNKMSEIEAQVATNTTMLAVIDSHDRFTSEDGLELILTIEAHLRDIREQDAEQPNRAEVQEMLDRLAANLRRESN
jgi:hypothetical protein